MDLRLLTLFGILIASTQLNAQDKYNLDFEHLDPSRQPIGWNIPGNQTDYRIRLDSVNRQNGNYAILIERSNNNSSKFGTFGMPVNAPVSGSKLKLTGYIKTQDVTGGFAGLYIRVEDDGGTTLAFDNMRSQNIVGTGDWKEYSTEITFNSKFTGRLNIGALLVGGGKVWFDNLHLYVDGKPIEHVSVKPLTAIRTIDQKTLQTASDELTQNYTPAKLDQLADFARIWGFLKYYHPSVTSGKLNWDSTLVSMVPRIINATPQDAYKLEETMIDSMGTVQTCAGCLMDTFAKIKPATEYGGLFTANHLPPSLTQKLIFIRDNYDGRNDSYYMGLTLNGGAEIHNEYPYSNTTYPPAIVRLIALFRYWNVMEYFYPYRDLISQEWDSALPELIPVFIHAADKNEYVLACLKMIAHLHDSHAGLAGSNLDTLKGVYMTPVQAKFVENKLVVIHYFGADSTTIKTGDVIQQIDGVPVDSLLKKYLPLTTGSNIEVQLRDLPRPYGWLLRSNTQTATLTIEHDGTTRQISVQRLPVAETQRYFPFSDIPKEPAFKLIDQNIGYIVPDKLKDNDIDTIRERFKDTRGIIIDLRCYPSSFMPFTYGSWFKSTTSPFAYFTRNSTRTPGVFVPAGPVKNGGGSHTYKGKLILIVNSISQSNAEYTTMSLRSTPGALVVGSMTAGADGNVSQIFLPGGIASAFSGLGVYYPDWSQTQRVGVRIDIPVHQTIKGIREGRDEYLEAALKLLQ